MAETKIEWATHTWNPVSGCTKISEGCRNCYAERMSKRLAGRCGYPAGDPFNVTLHQEKLEDPMNWKKPRRIFVCSMSDLFHEDVPDEFIFKVFNTMANAQWIFGHKFMVLTKRPERMRRIIESIRDDLLEQAKPEKLPNGMTRRKMTFSFPLRNIWLGVTAENQEQASKRIPILLETPATKRFVSIEPMLGPVDLKSLWQVCPECGSWEIYEPRNDTPYCDDCGAEDISPRIGLDWVIAGGETGPGARPCHPDWIRNLRDQCQAAGTKFFFKQWGEFKPVYLANEFRGNEKVGKKKAGRLLDGREWNEIPEV